MFFCQYWVICKCDLFVRSISLCATLTENMAVQLRLLFDVFPIEKRPFERITSRAIKLAHGADKICKGKPLVRFAQHEILYTFSPVHIGLFTETEVVTNQSCAFLYRAKNRSACGVGWTGNFEILSAVAIQTCASKCYHKLLNFFSDPYSSRICAYILMLPIFSQGVLVLLQKFYVAFFPACLLVLNMKAIECCSSWHLLYICV